MTDYHRAHLTPDPARAVVWAAVAAHLSRWIDPASHVLEVGAGYCDWINNVRAAHRVAVDAWPDFVNFAATGVQAVVLDATVHLRTVGEGSYDVVLASNVLEHFSPDTAASVVSDVAAVLKPGGRVILIQPNFRLAWRRYFDDYTHRAIFTDVSLPALLASRGLRTELVEPRFLPYSMRETALPVRPWLVSAYLRSPIKPMAGQMLVVARKD
ncbi:MAG: class I SAM-dependent methyltransferase [Vicinamibacterales bacterium]